MSEKQKKCSSRCEQVNGVQAVFCEVREFSRFILYFTLGNIWSASGINSNKWERVRMAWNFRWICVLSLNFFFYLYVDAQVTWIHTHFADENINSTTFKESSNIQETQLSRLTWSVVFNVLLSTRQWVLGKIWVKFNDLMI